MVRRRVFPAAALAVAVLLGVGGCTEPTPEPVRLSIATGSQTGVYYVFGKAYAAIVERELPYVETNVLITTASAQNVELVGDGRAQLGFTQADILPSTGNKVMAVARVYDDLLHLVTRADGPVRDLADLKGRRVSVGAPGSGTAITANRLLDVAELAGDRVEVHQLGLDASAAALRKGEIDAFFFSGGPPVRAVEQLVADLPIRLVELGGWTDALRVRYSEVYVSRDVPYSVYGLDPISTVADPNYLVVPAGMDEDLVFELTRMLMEHRDELGVAHPAAGRMNPQSAIATAPLPLHPGAARYYQSIKP
ncbi:TAXI family TRAP transporter solute-binding subunit [Catellatospora bangladeshensis]|uniref:C4-dicarboxylate ABC transporter substrate-binding protein n=1 Tax=Catellatospora bangladeshensis TaxID=310355 RepID=A0A8J3JWB4_9ACTN|nr:TAXI family TRAP transporter solute-binding subunit [Catellatospora bangladeshensis]GIF84264.1 C4-dicarboxylate ABC transporter substrate-binding protein [Catellatospora bangladeshensis]